MKRTLDRCRKFEGTGKSCFSEPALRDVILAAPLCSNDAEPVIPSEGLKCQPELRASGLLFFFLLVFKKIFVCSILLLKVINMILLVLVDPKSQVSGERPFCMSSSIECLCSRHFWICGYGPSLF